VDLDKGYEYRIVEFDDDGNMTRTDWVGVKQWTGILDVSRTIEEPDDGDAGADEDLSE